MKLSPQRKRDLIIFFSVFTITFLLLAVSLHYSPLEVKGLPIALQMVIGWVMYPAVALTIFPSIFITTSLLCPERFSCPGLIDAYTFENAVIMILTSFFSALLYGFLALFFARFGRYIKKRFAKA